MCWVCLAQGELGVQGRQAACGPPGLCPGETPTLPGSAWDPQPGQRGTAVGWGWGEQDEAPICEVWPS